MNNAEVTKTVLELVTAEKVMTAEELVTAAMLVTAEMTIEVMTWRKVTRCTLFSGIVLGVALQEDLDKNR